MPAISTAAAVEAAGEDEPVKEQWESLTSTTSNPVNLDQQDGLEAAGACYVSQIEGVCAMVLPHLQHSRLASRMGWRLVRQGA